MLKETIPHCRSMLKRSLHNEYQQQNVTLSKARHPNENCSVGVTRCVRFQGIFTPPDGKGANFTVGANTIHPSGGIGPGKLGNTFQGKIGACLCG